MPAYVSTSVFKNGSSVIEAVEALIAAGISNIELGSIHEYEEGLEEKLRAFDFNAITHNFFPPAKERLILNIASLNAGVRERSLAFIKDAIDFAVKIGAPLYTIHPGFSSDPIGESDSPENHDFRFEETTRDIGHEEAFENFLRGIQEIEKYIHGKPIRVAVETQGSVTKKDVVMLARPEEFDVFLKKNTNRQIGINLNLAHVYLASNAWGFDRQDFIEKVKPRVMAIEVTHNDGYKDDHQALRADGWYMDVVRDPFFHDVPIIFEGRDIPENQVIESYHLLKGSAVTV